MIIDYQSLEGLKRCEYESISHAQTVIGGILRAVKSDPDSFNEPHEYDPNWQPPSQNAKGGLPRFDFYENDVIDVWEALVEGSLKKEAEQERSSLIYLASQIAELPWQSGEVRNAFNSLFMLAVGSRESDSGQLVSEIEARILELNQGKTGMDGETVETYLNLAKKAVLKLYDSSRANDHRVAMKAVEMLGLIGDDGAKEHLRTILYSMASPSSARGKADIILRGSRVENELESANMTKETVLGKYPKDGPQEYFINTTYEAISIILGKKDILTDPGDPDIMMAIKTLTSVTDNLDRVNRLMGAGEGISEEIPVAITSPKTVPTNNIRCWAEGKNGGLVNMAVSDPFPKQEQVDPHGIAPIGQNEAKRVVRDIKFDIENALLHAMTSQNTIIREEAIFGISNVHNERVEYILRKMIDRYSPRSEIGAGAQTALAKIANKKAMAGMDWDDCPEEPLPSAFLAVTRRHDTDVDTPHISRPSKNVAQTVKRTGR